MQKLYRKVEGHELCDYEIGVVLRESEVKTS
jgi:hypothetical protein